MTLMKWTNNPVLNEMLSGMQKRTYHSDCNFNRPAANIIDNENDFVIELAVPGMVKKDFKINIEKDVLSVSVEKQESEEKVEKNYSRREFSYEGFCRSFSIPEIINQDEIKADYKNGVLSLKLPKNEEIQKKSKEIKIS